MSLVIEEFKQQSHVVAETFPDNVDVYYMFVDRVLEDVVSDMIREKESWEIITSIDTDLRKPRYQIM